MSLEHVSLNIEDLTKRINQLKEIVEMVRNGKSIAEIAAMYGVAQSTIYDIIRANRK